MSEAHDIWNYPKGGKVPDLADVLQAVRVSEMVEIAGPAQVAVLRAHEATRDRAIEGAREVAADLKAKGIDFDVGRMLRPSLWERVQEVWDGVWDRWRDRAAPEGLSMPSDRYFAFDLTLALTHPSRSLSMDHDVMERHVAQMVDALTRQISAQRGRGPMQVSIPDAVHDDVLERDEDADAATLADAAQSAVGYWPPNGQPALMLVVVWSEPESPVEVKLLAHGSPAHRRFVAELEALGGSVG